MSELNGKRAKRTRISTRKSRESGRRPRRFSFRITSEGFMLLVVILLVGFAAWHSGTNLLYLIFSILVAFYLAHGFLLSVNLSRLAISTQAPDVVTAGQKFEILTTITNRKRLAASYAIRAVHYSYQGTSKAIELGTVYFPRIPRKSIRAHTCAATLPRRGIHTLDAVSVSTRYPFGFEERGQTRPGNSRILALPQTYNVATVVAKIPFGFGDQESHVRGSGTELYGLREYIPGEHARHMHWKTSARVQKLMMAEYSRDERRQIVLFLNNGLPADFQESAQQENASDDFEHAVILTASLARHLIDAGFEVGLITADDQLPVGQGSSHLLAIMRRLAIIAPVKPGSINLPDAVVLQVVFHSNGDAATNGHHTIDSRTWEPHRDPYAQGGTLL